MELLIFLDVDGVLNHEPETVDCGDKLRKFAGDMLLGGFSLLCPGCIERLNQFIKVAIADLHYDKMKIILSSTWRRYFEPIEFTQMMAVAEFDFPITGRTAVNDKDRGQQIVDYIAWLDRQEEFRYIVLDDDVMDMDLVKENQVVTNHRTGFDERALTEAINLIFKLR